MAADLATPERRLAALGLLLPEPPGKLGTYLRAGRAGRLVHVSGQTPMVGLVTVVAGAVGAGVDPAAARAGARLAVLNSLSQLRAELGTLDAVERVVKMTGFVVCAPGFTALDPVLDGASALLEAVFGDAGRHARTAVGVAGLPGGAAVEVELVVSVSDILAGSDGMPAEAGRGGRS